MSACRRLQSLQQQQQHVTSQHKASSDNHHRQLSVASRQVAPVSGAGTGAWSAAERAADMSDSDDDDGADICVVDEDDTPATTINDLRWYVIVPTYGRLL